MEEIELDENDEITPYPTSNQMNQTGKTEETLIQNEGAEDDYFLTNSQNIRLNEEKVKDIVNSKSVEETPEGNQEMEIIEEIPKETEKKYPKINMNHTMNKISHKKSNVKRKLISEEKNEKNNNDENTDELFKKAIENTSRIYPPIEHDNDLSVKVTEILYDKYVGKNVHKSKHLDIYSKFKDESIKQEREWTRTKDDAKRISNMIERQEKYEELKHDKKIGRQREQKKKIKKICVFIPNGKNNKTIQENIRTHSQFYSDQKKFVAKKEEYINKLAQNRIQTEENNKKTITVSKKSEIIANIKNPNETLEQFCKRLAEEKLKTPKETLNQKQKAEIKKMTKKEMQDLTEKLYKEGETFKINREKKEKEIVDKLKDSRNKKVFVLEKSTKVIFDKFVNEYDKIVKDLFGDKNDDEHKIQNYEINIEEYKILLVNLGFMKNEIGENENNDLLIKNSFNNYLNPKEGKIETNKFLVFSLAALGIYKGRDEKIIEHCSNITPKFKPEEEKENEKNNNNEENQNPKVSNININNNPPKKQIKTSSDFIKLNLPNFDLDKYSYTEKECNTIKSEFFPFVLRINEVWSKGLAKKKQERLDKLEDATKKINLEETKKLENKSKKEEIIDSFHKKLFSQEPRNSNTGNNSPLKKTFRVEDMYEILQKKKQRELDTLKAKKEEDINKECTFQPNAQTKKSYHKKEIEKNIEKLYTEGKKSFIKKRQLEDDNLKKLEKECTFQPVIKDYKGNYFENNPLKEDKLVNTEIKKMEKLREQQGYANKVIKKQMAFDIEPKTNKDNINKRVAQKRGEKIVSKVKNEFINYGSFDDKGKQIRIKLEINLENNAKETLVIQPQDDFIKVVDDFCAKFGLNDDKKIRIIRTIKDKMRKNGC